MSNIDKLYKLAELVKRGVGGEAKNAEIILKKLLDKEGITLDEFLNTSNEVKSEYPFRYWDKWDLKLLKQIYSMVTDSKLVSWSKAKRVKELWFNLTKSQYIEMSYLYEVYRKALSKEFDRETEAFILKNNIYYQTDDSCSSSHEMTEEELEEWEKIYAKLGGTNFIQIHKAIEKK